MPKVLRTTRQASEEVKKNSKFSNPTQGLSKIPRSTLNFLNGRTQIAKQSLAAPESKAECCQYAYSADVWDDHFSVFFGCFFELSRRHLLLFRSGISITSCFLWKKRINLCIASYRYPLFWDPQNSSAFFLRFRLFFCVLCCFLVVFSRLCAIITLSHFNILSHLYTLIM